MTIKLFRVIITILLSLNVYGQNRHFCLGYECNGICFGNSENCNGIRLNAWDNNVNNINGISISGFCDGKINNGLTIGLIASSSNKHNGIAISGLILQASKLNGIGASMITFGDTLNGVFIGLYGVAHLNVDDNIKVINGVVFGTWGVRALKMNGLSIGIVQNKFDIQNGVSISIYNKTKELHGFQFGLINYAGNNRRIFRWTPFFNFNLNKKANR
jgi:hypothetical protein